MKMFPSSPRHRSSADGTAFTLIELLVVISIIAVLAGLLLPVIGKVTENARKVSAKSTETQVVSAINNYQTEYGQYPVATTAGATPADTTFGADDHNYVLFNALRAVKSGDATQDALNSRQIVYFEGKNVKSTAVPKDGFIVTEGGKSTKKQTAFKVGDLVDPWGNCYFARIDTNYSNLLKNPYADGSAQASDDTATPPAATDATVLRLGSVCYSFGYDGDPGTTKAPNNTSPYSNLGDDVVSWE